jgi:hypothetical protein
MSKEKLSRRELIRRFGMAAFLLHPILRSMAMAASPSFTKGPRFIMFFKGGSFYPSRTNPAAITNLAGTPLAPLQAYSSDLVLFKNMSIHGGSPKSNGYQEEHGAGLMGCVTGNSYKYSKNDSYYAYTDFESIDMRIARHYQTDAELSKLPISSLHVGGGAHSDSDSTGLGQRYISYRNRIAGDTQYGNAIEPIQNSGQVYESLMQRINLVCSGASNQPNADTAKLLTALKRKKSVLDFKIQDINDAKKSFGLDSEHSRKLDGLLEGWRQVEKLTMDQITAAETSTPSTGTKACPTLAKPTGDGSNKQNLDLISPVHDQMISLIKLAFEWDLTRVVAFTLSGASCGQTWPSQGVNSAHHSMEHSNNVDGLVKIDSYYSQKFAGLLSALKTVDDGNGQSALYNTSAILGMECWSNSSSGHYLTNIPFVFAGQGGGRFTTGRIIDAAGRNNNDLLISCQNASGITDTTFGLASLCKGSIL